MNDSLASWVPPSVLVFVCVALLSVLWRKFDRLLEKIIERLDTIEKSLHQFATTEGVGRMGDRLDGRITNIAERVAVLEARRRK